MTHTLHIAILIAFFMTGSFLWLAILTLFNPFGVSSLQQDMNNAFLFLVLAIFSATACGVLVSVSHLAW